MAIVSSREALKTLADFSISEEFCQKFGGKVFGYAGEATLAHQQLCAIFSLLVDHMTDGFASHQSANSSPLQQHRSGGILRKA